MFPTEFILQRKLNFIQHILNLPLFRSLFLKGLRKLDIFMKGPAD